VFGYLIFILFSSFVNTCRKCYISNTREIVIGEYDKVADLKLQVLRFVILNNKLSARVVKDLNKFSE